jgi:hypothetical protein
LQEQFLRTIGMSIVTAAAVQFAAFAASANPADPLDQRWSEKDKVRWYEAGQGSRLLPLEWYLALEQPGSEALFNDDDHIRGFRYLPRTTSTGLDLPVGFAVDTADDSKLNQTRLRWKAGQTSREPWLGMNCSACHTAELSYNGQAIRVEGGPTLADFQGFLGTLTAALAETLSDEAKFGRFADRILGISGSDRDALKSALARQVKWQSTIVAMNTTDLEYGFGRLDAFGNIFNKVALVASPDAPTGNPSDAPVSYPFLWNVPQHDRVQWNGIAKNLPIDPFSFSDPFDPGALARNIGEVIGVFADITPVKGAPISGYNSSLDIPNLVALEQMLGKLLPPLWPDAILGAPDPALIAQGEQLYADNCISCHLPLARTDLTTRIEAQMSLFDGSGKGGSQGKPPGTDPWMACNAYTYGAATGVLEGTGDGYFVGTPLPAMTEVATMLTVTVLGGMANNKKAIAESAARAFIGISRPPQIKDPSTSTTKMLTTGRPQELDSVRALRLQRCMTEKSDILGYKARPLTGIWATAPYLHNGSVPTLYDLLLPPQERPDSFWVGSREFDPVNVGYITTQDADNSFEFRTRDDTGHMIPGNSNAGHDYDNGALTEQERRALVEYIKTL